MNVQEFRDALENLCDTALDSGLSVDDVVAELDWKQTCLEDGEDD